MSGQNSRWRPWCFVATLLLLAVAAIGVGGSHLSGARAQPAALIDLLKKKAAAKGKSAVDAKKGLLGKSSSKGVPVGPKNATGRAAVPSANSKSVLGKGTETPGSKGVTKGGAPKTATSANLSKGAGPKGTATALPKGGGPKGGATAALSKSGGPRGFATGAQPKGGGPNGIGARGGFASPRLAGTRPERLRLRADHRLAIVAAQRLLPQRPLPGQRGFTGVPPVGETRFVSTELMLRIGPNVSRQSVDDTARRLGLTIISAQPIGIAEGTIYHFRLAGGRPVAEVVRTLETQNIGVAQPNYTYRLLLQDEPEPATQSEEATQYVIGKLHLEEVHKVATGKDVLIAVIDSAIDLKHPDLSGSITEEYDAVGRVEQPQPHGTGMVGAITAHQRLRGIAPGAKILAIHAFSGTAQSAQATTRNILTGIDWAVKKGARVINMSFAGPYDPMLQVALKNARAKGVVLVAASGNQGPKSPPLYPAADPNVIGVTATDQNDELFGQAVRGPQVAVAAPGVDVMVPAPSETYQMTTGTSVAAAHVSGVAALLIERHPEVSAQTILEVLTSSATHLNPKGRDNLFGWGLVDPAAALAELDSRMEDSQVASNRPASSKPALPAQASTPQMPRGVLAPIRGE